MDSSQPLPPFSLWEPYRETVIMEASVMRLNKLLQTGQVELPLILRFMSQLERTFATLLRVVALNTPMVSVERQNCMLYNIETPDESATQDIICYEGYDQLELHRVIRRINHIDTIIADIDSHLPSSTRT